MLPKIHDILNDHSGTRAKSELHKLGYEVIPIEKFGDTEYAFLHYRAPRPGPNTAEVINITQFDSGSKFTIFRGGPYAYICYFDEGGMSILTVHNGELYEYDNPFTAVLAFRVEPPTRDDIRAVADMLDDELQQYGPRWPL